MRGYGKIHENLDEYETDLEEQCEYEDVHVEGSEDEEDEDEEEEKEEVPMSKEVISYLSIRERMKDKHRSVLVENGAFLDHSLKNFGSFFGPSKPVIADRVIQERKSLSETRHLTPKASTSQNDVRKFSMSSSSASKDGQRNKPLAKQVKTKAQIIKDTRDYSFLSSDDANDGKTTRDTGPGKTSSPKSEGRALHLNTKHSNPSLICAASRPSASEQRKLSSGISQVHATQGTPSGFSSSGKKASLGSSDSKRQLDVRRHPQSSKQMGITGRSELKPAISRVLSPKTPLPSDSKRLLAGSMEKKPLAAHVGNKTPVDVKSSSRHQQIFPVAKPQSSVVAARNTMSKKGTGVSKIQMEKPSNQVVRSNLEKGRYIKKQNIGRQAIVHNDPAAPKKDQNYKKCKVRDTSFDEEFDYRSEIRNLLGYRPTQYDDDDDDSMEVGFDTIQTEELRSARIGRKEDEIELAKIMEEEKQERLRKRGRNRMRKMKQQ